MKIKDAINKLKEEKKKGKWSRAHDQMIDILEKAKIPLIKRNHWTNQEILHLIEYCLGEKHPTARLQLDMMFQDFDVSFENPAAAAFDFEQNLIVGVGPQLPR